MIDVWILLEVKYKDIDSDLSGSNPWSSEHDVLGLATQPPTVPTCHGSIFTELSSLLLPLVVLLVYNDVAVPVQLPVNVPPDHLELEPGVLLPFQLVVQTTPILHWLLLQVTRGY